MDPARQSALDNEWNQINQRLDQLVASRPADAQPSEEEQRLLDRLDEIEYEVGLEYLTALRRETKHKQRRT